MHERHVTTNCDPDSFCKPSVCTAASTFISNPLMRKSFSFFANIAFQLALTFGLIKLMIFVTKLIAAGAFASLPFVPTYFATVFEATDLALSFNMRYQSFTKKWTK